MAMNAQFGIPIVPIVLVVAAACGGGSDSSPSPTSPSPTPAPTQDPAPSPGPSANVLATWQGNLAIQIHNFYYDGPVELRITQQQSQSVEGHFRCLGDCGRGIGTGVDFKGNVSGNGLKFSFDVLGEESGTARWDFDLSVANNTLGGRVHRYWISGAGSDHWGDVKLTKT